MRIYVEACTKMAHGQVNPVKLASLIWVAAEITIFS